MTEQLGYESYLGAAVESSWGSYLAPTHFIPLKTEDTKPIQEWRSTESEMRASRFKQAPLAGNKHSPINHLFFLYPDVLGMFLLAMFSTPDVSHVDTGVEDNTFEPGITADKSLSLCVSKGGTNPLEIAGVMLNELNFNLAGVEGEAGIWEVNIVGGGKFGVEGSPASPVYTARKIPLQDHQTVLTVGGATHYLDNLSVGLNNGLKIPNHQISAGAETRQAIRTARFNGIGSFQINHEDLTNFDKFRQGTEGEIIITVTSTQEIETGYYYTLTMTIPKVRYNENPLPAVASPDLLKEAIAFDMLEGTVGASSVPISIKLRCATDWSA